jgi:hypothetical protein
MKERISKLENPWVYYILLYNGDKKQKENKCW